MRVGDPEGWRLCDAHLQIVTFVRLAHHLTPGSGPTTRPGHLVGSAKSCIRHAPVDWAAGRGVRDTAGCVLLRVESCVADGGGCRLQRQV
jgi:hypothetical protein